MSDTSSKKIPSSLEESSSSSLLTILLVVLAVGLVVGGGILVHHYWGRGNESSKLEEARRKIYDVENKVPAEEDKEHLIYKKAHDGVLGNQFRVNKLLKKVKQNPTEWGKWKTDVENIQQKLKSLEELRQIGRQNPDRVWDFYVEVYRQEEIIKNLSQYLLANNEVKNVLEIQQKWLADEEARQQEKAKATQVVGELISHFYDRFMAEEFSAEERENWCFRNLKINGKAVDPTEYHEVIDYLVSQNYKFKDINSGETIEVKRNKPNWTGFEMFFGEDEEAKKKEGTNCLGVTKTLGGSYESLLDNYSFEFAPKRKIHIELREHFLFNRQNHLYDEWITETNEEGRGTVWYYFNISEENLINTIAHELAHAVISSVKFSYEGEDKEGHGTLHDEYTDKIETMIKEDQVRYNKFLDWWREERSN